MEGKYILENESQQPKLHRALGLRDLVLLNVAAILGLRWLSTAAQIGPSSLALWFLAMLVFFIPSGLAVMELNSRLPGEGGVYLWSKAAFGELHGFITGWGYWVNNLFYFPTLLLFVASVVLYIAGSSWLQLAENAWYNGCFSLGLLWVVVVLNIVGIERGKWIQNLGGLSTWVAASALFVLGFIAWFRFGSNTEFSIGNVIPNLSQSSTISFFATMTFAFAGLELAPVMAGEIKEPRRLIPRAMFISGITIAVIYVLGTLTLLIAIPQGEVDVISGIPQAFAAIGKQLATPSLGILGAVLIALSSTGGLGAWLSGTARVPFVIGIDEYLPKALGNVHPRWGSPHVALLTQGVFATLLLLAGVAGSTIKEAYLILLDMAIILYFIPFLYMFAALPVLRARNADNGENVFLIPGGKVGIWTVAGLGLLTTLLSIVLSVIPPQGTENPELFVLKIVGGCILFVVTGLIFYSRGRKQDQ